MYVVVVKISHVGAKLTRPLIYMFKSIRDRVTTGIIAARVLLLFIVRPLRVSREERNGSYVM